MTKEALAIFLTQVSSLPLSLFHPPTQLPRGLSSENTNLPTFSFQTTKFTKTSLARASLHVACTRHNRSRVFSAWQSFDRYVFRALAKWTADVSASTRVNGWAINPSNPMADVWREFRCLGVFGAFCPVKLPTCRLRLYKCLRCFADRLGWIRVLLTQTIPCCQ